MKEISPLSPERREQLFPTLNDAQIERIAAAGRQRLVEKNTVLINQGEANVPFFVVVSGRLDIIQPTDQGELVSCSITMESSPER